MPALLADELGTYPSPETESIYRALLEAPSPAPPVKAKTEPAAILNGTETRGRAVIRFRTRRPAAALVIVAAAALVVAAAITVPVVELTGADRAGLTSAAPNSAAVIDAKSNRLVSDLRVGAGPTSIAVGEGTVWATSEQEPAVLRIDPGVEDVQRIPVDGDPSGIAVGADAVWVTNSLDATVMRIDPGTNRVVQTIPVGVTPNAIVFARRSAVGDQRRRPEPERDQPGQRSRRPEHPDWRGRPRLAVGDGAVWVTDESSRSVMRIDPVSGKS